MTMKWNVSGGTLALATAVTVAVAGDAGKDGSGGSSPARKAATVSSTVASPRAYRAGAATVRATDYEYSARMGRR